MSGRSDLVDIDVTIHREPDPTKDGRSAWLVSSVVSSPEKIWVPEVLCEISDRQEPPRKGATMTLSESLAQEKGLI